MSTRKMFERINWYKKEYVHDNYSRIVEPFKNYERISKKKMLEEIYKVYDNPENIVDICMTKELKFLKMLLDSKTDMDELCSEKYSWERKTLCDKFLIQDNFHDVFIPDEIVDKVKEAFHYVNWTTARKLDDLNEILVGYCKTQGTVLLYTAASIASAITGISEDDIITHMFHNKVFHYYVYGYSKEIEDIEKDVPVLVCQDYYALEEDLAEQRKKQGLAGVIPLDVNMFRTIFYHDFDIHNKKVKKMLDEIQKLPFFWNSALDSILYFALLNIDREPLKESFRRVPALQNIDLTKFFKVLDEAMDEMPSGALNGFTPNQAKSMKIEHEKLEYEKLASYEKQEDACLSKRDADLFYKIYFGLLDYTNQKYHIKEHFKIYRKKHINPYDLQNIIDKFWKNKKSIVTDFYTENPYHFNEEELDITHEFQKGFRDLVIIAKFEKEYTAVMTQNKVYMIKGVNANIDEIISYQDLPEPVMTSIIPFKNYLIYDGLLNSFPVKMGDGFTKAVAEDYEKSMKYYHL